MAAKLVNSLLQTLRDDRLETEEELDRQLTSGAVADGGIRQAVAASASSSSAAQPQGQSTQGSASAASATNTSNANTSPGSASSSGALPHERQPPARREDSDPLGGCAENVPMEIHLEMLRTFEQGQLPATTLAQRQRNKLSTGSEYGVPGGSQLGTALRYGYLRPNLPPPSGTVWRGQGRVWKLVFQGG